MRKVILHIPVLLVCSLLLAGHRAQQISAQTAASTYPKMAPLEQYLMDSDAEITLARSAAPEAISRDASVMVMSGHGYQIAVQGKNGWTCIVDRGWGGDV
jgi:hypothetical protein